MTKIFNKQVFNTTYKDDHADSDGYHRILFNSGRALQARELTQLQTIVQKEITRLGQNVFKDGAPVNNSASSFNKKLEFIKIKASTPLPSNVDIIDNVFVGQTSGIKVRVDDKLAATATDPETIYVTYLETPSSQAGETALRVTANETLSGTIDGSTYTFDVQQENSSSNPATGKGLSYQTGEGSFFAVGRFVFSPAQTIYLSKYDQNYNGEIVFKVTEDIVTSSDDVNLFDNQGATPNRSSPGADRYRIRLTLSKLEDLDSDENHVPYSKIVDGKEVTKVSSSEGFNEIGEHVATRVREIHGNFIKKYFKTRFLPNNDTTFKLEVDPGLAYIDGYRIEKRETTPIIVKRAQETTTIDNQGILADYGNYFLVSDALGAKGMLNFDDCELVNLYRTTGGQNSIGTCRVRAITEFQNNQYRLHVFSVTITDNSYSLRNVRSVGTSTSNYYNIDFSSNTTLRDTKKKTLLFDSPIPRPKNFSSVSLSSQRRFSGTTTGGGALTITLTTSGETFENTNDWIFASAADGFLGSVTTSLTGGSTSATLSGLPASTAVEVLAYVKKGLAKIRPKTLTETTVSGRLDSDGDGVKYLALGKSDIFSLNRVRINDSDGNNVFTNFKLDTGHRDTHYDDGKLIWKGVGDPKTDSAGGNGTTIFARFKHFAHGTGDFFAVSSYTGQVDYIDVPAHKMENGRLVSLRDVLDFRPATNGSGSFTVVNELPQPTDTVELDAEFYLPRKDKLVLSSLGELRYLQGTASITPKFPDTPTDCIDLYKYELNPFTLHTKDMKARILPLKGYTMADINKLETKLDKVEEMATLSMLELKTQSLKALDSAGADRTKSGFFVDNFSNHAFSDIRSVEYRATIDPQKKLLRPPKKETTIDLRFDSENAGQLNVKKSGDLITLDYSVVDYKQQNTASRTENLNPFFIEKVVGYVTLSPSSDYWKETDIRPPEIIDQPTVLDTSNAVNWNNHEWDWGGVSLDDLEVGASQGQVTGTSTSTTSNTLEPTITGSTTQVDQSDWTVTGTTSDTTSLGTQTDIVSQETEEVFTSAFGGVEITDPTQLGLIADVWVDENPMTGGVRGGTSITVGTIDTIQTTTTETRETTETIDTTTLAQTTTTTTETEFQTETQITTNTSTTTTVNRISGEHTVREVVGQRVFDLISIPWMRSRKISFKADGLRPSTRYFPFFGSADVSAYCISTGTFKRHSDRDPETRTTSITPAVTHSEQTPANANLISDTSGNVVGEFEIPNNSAMRFPTGQREFLLCDISVPNKDDALSFATTQFTSTGHIEPVQDIIHSTRILEVTGSASTTDRTDTSSTFTTSTDVAVTTEVAEDVQTESTVTETVTGTETNSEVTDSQTITTQIGIYADPLAQTFQVGVEDQNGVFIKKIRVFFATKDDTGLPVMCQIRPTVNGVPASTDVVPGAISVLPQAQVTAIEDTYSDPTIDEMLANGTDFEFEEPIYLAPLKEYAIVLQTPSMKYRTYISRVEDFTLGSTEKRISEQPDLGSLFKSQNSMLWEPSQTEDLAYQLFRCEFNNSGNALLENVNVDPTVLTKNPFAVVKADVDAGGNKAKTVTVINRGHGLRRGDISTISGLDPDTRFNGVLGSSIIGNRTVTSVDGTAYQFLADSAFDQPGRFGGGRCNGSTNPTFDLVWPTVQTMKVPTTNITMSAKFTTNSSLVDSSSGRFIQDNTFSLIQNQKNNYFNAPRCIINPNEESTELTTYSYPKSAIVQMSMTSTDSKVSPVIDMQRAGLAMIGNMIDKQDSASTDGYNVPLSYFPETTIAGSSLAKHITQEVTLEETAKGIKVILAANKPPEADFKVYYKTGEAEDRLKAKTWVLATPDNVLPSDTNPSKFREYRYTIGGFGDINNLSGADLPDFRKFKLKIVMESTNSAKVPIIRDLRAIALAI